MLLYSQLRVLNEGFPEQVETYQRKTHFHLESPQMTVFKTSCPNALRIKLSECLALPEMGWHGIFGTTPFLWDVLLVVIK